MKEKPSNDFANDLDFISRRRAGGVHTDQDNIDARMDAEYEYQTGRDPDDTTGMAASGTGNARAASAAIQSFAGSSGPSSAGRAGAGIMSYGAATADPTAVGIGATLSTLDAINQGKKREGEKREMKKLQRIQLQQQALSNLTSINNNLRRL